MNQENQNQSNNQTDGPILINTNIDKSINNTEISIDETSQVLLNEQVKRTNTISSQQEKVATPSTPTPNQTAPITIQPTVDNTPIQPLVSEPNIAVPQSSVMHTEKPQVVVETQPRPEVINSVQAPVASQELVTPSSQVMAAVQPQPTATESQVQTFNMGAQPAPGQQPNDTQLPIVKPRKVPLITLAAQLTFRSSDPSKPKTLFAKLLGIIMVIIALIASAGCIYATQHIRSARQEIKELSNPTAAKKESDTKQAIKDSGPDKQPMNGDTVDVTKLFDASLAQRPQDIYAGIKEQINIANGLSFGVSGFERNWETGDNNYKPGKGKEYIKIALSAGSRTKSGGVYASEYSFKILNSKGALQDTEFLKDSILPDNELTTASGSINGGGTRNGWLVYEVDKGEAITLVYEAKGYDANSKEFIMKGSVEIK